MQSEPLNDLRKQLESAVSQGNSDPFDLRCTHAAHGLKLTLLEHAEQLGLKLQWQISNFVEEQRATVRQRKEKPFANDLPKLRASPSKRARSSAPSLSPPKGRR